MGAIRPLGDGGMSEARAVDGRGYQTHIQIVTYNSRAVIAACLQKVLAQDGVTARVTVIDNASQDDTVALVQETFPHVRVIRNPTNTGYAAAHNQGIRLALQEEAAYVLTLNPDVQLAPSYLAQITVALAKELRTGKQVAGATGKLTRADGRTLDSTGLEMRAFWHARDRGSGEIDRGQYDALRSVWGICGAAAVYTAPFLRTLADRGELFDETFFVYKEDVDMCWRAGLLRWRCVYVPEAQAVHERGWKVGETISTRALAHSLANQIALLIAYAKLRSLYTWLCVGIETVRLGFLFARRPVAACAATELIRQHFSHNREKRKRWLAGA